MKYYLMVESNCQWESIILEEGDSPTIPVSRRYALDSGISGSFLMDICKREMHFTNKKFEGTTWYGWTLSPREFNRIKRLIDIYPIYREYLKLSETV